MEKSDSASNTESESNENSKVKKHTLNLNLLKQLIKDANMDVKSMLKTGILNSDIQKILTKEINLKKKVSGRQKEIPSSDREAPEEAIKMKKVSKSNSFSHKPEDSECDSTNSSDNDTDFPKPIMKKVIKLKGRESFSNVLTNENKHTGKEESDVDTYSSSNEAVFPQPKNIKNESKSEGSSYSTAGNKLVIQNRSSSKMSKKPSANSDTIDSSNKINHIDKEDSNVDSDSSLNEHTFPQPKNIKNESESEKSSDSTATVLQSRNVSKTSKKTSANSHTSESDATGFEISQLPKKRTNYLKTDSDECSNKLMQNKKNIKKRSPGKKLKSPQTEMPIKSSSDESSEDEAEVVKFNRQDSTSEYDEKLIERIEEAVTVNILQNVTLSPVKLVNPQDQLLEMYPHLKMVKTKVNIDFPNSDVYLLRIPVNIDPHHLLNQKIKLHKPCKMRLGEKYVFEATTKQPDPMLVISDDSKIIQFKSNVLMSKYIKTKNIPEIEVPTKTPVDLPANLKDRHPLFGSHFEDKIQLSKDVEQKLDDAIKNILKTNIKEVKKRKEKKQKLIQETEPEEIIFSLLNASKSTRKSTANIRNLKVKHNSELSDDSAFSSGGSSRNIEKGNTDTAQLIEKVIYEPLKGNENEITKSPKKRSQELMNMKKEILSEYETDIETKLSRKRKRSSHNTDCSEEFHTEVQVQIGEDTHETMKKKKKKLSEYETDIETKLSKKPKRNSHNMDCSEKFDTEFQMDEDNHDNMKKKKENVSEYETDIETKLSTNQKRSSHNDSSDDFHIEDQMDEDNHQTTKKKKKKFNELLHMKKEVLTEYETDAEILTQKKQRKNMQNKSYNNQFIGGAANTKNQKLESLKREVLTEYETDAETLTQKKQRKNGEKNKSCNDRLIGHIAETKNKKLENLIGEVLTEYETDAESLIRKKKRKNVEKSKSFDNQLIGHAADTKNKKLASLKREVLTEYETDAETLIRKKQRKNVAKSESFNNQLIGHAADTKNKKLASLKREVVTEYETDTETLTLKKQRKNGEKNKSCNNQLIDHTTNTKNNKLENLKREVLTEYETDAEIKTQRIAQRLKKMKREYENDVEINKQNKRTNIERLENMTDKERAISRSLDIMSIKKEMLTEYETDADTSAQRKKKKKHLENRRKSLANSTLKAEVINRPSFSPDLSIITSMVEKQLKTPDYNAEDDVINNTSIDSINTSSNELCTLKKIKKKRKDKNI